MATVELYSLDFCQDYWYPLRNEAECLLSQGNRELLRGITV